MLERQNTLPKLWNISNIPITRYKRLPYLRQPEGYVCIFQDLHSRNYFIGNSDHPKYLVSRWERRAPNRYKLVRILRANNAVELKKSLHQRYKEKWIRQHQGWFRLDSAELRELDGFIAKGSKLIGADAKQLERWNLRYFAGDFYKHLPKLKLPAGYVYVLRDVYTEDYKIGYTNHPIVRIKYLDERASGDVEYVHILQSDHVRETETFLHKWFHANRIRPGSEWFQLDNAQLQEIQQLARQPSTAHSSAEHRAPQVSQDTQPARSQFVPTRQRSRTTRILVLLLAIGVIMIAGVLVYMQYSMNDSKLALEAIDRPAQSTPIVSQ